MSEAIHIPSSLAVTRCRSGGCLARHSHYARVRLGGLIIWRIQCTSCKAVFTVLTHFVLRYRCMSPDVARQALMATHGGLSLEWCAMVCNISLMALYRLVCAFGKQSLVMVLVKCRRSDWILGFRGLLRRVAQ